MKVSLLERLSQVQQENRKSIEDVTRQMEKLKADVMSEIRILPELAEDTKAVSAVQERLMGVQKEFEEHREDSHKRFLSMPSKSDLANLSERQESSGAQLIDLADTFKKRLNQCEQKFQTDHSEIQETINTVNDALKQRLTQVQSTIVEDLGRVREELSTVDTRFKSDLDGTMRKLQDLTQSQFTMSECIMTVQKEVTQESGVIEEIRQSAQQNAERLNGTRIEIDEQLTVLKSGMIDINRVTLCNQGCLSGVESSIEDFKQRHQETEEMSREIKHCVKALESNVSDFSTSALRDITHQTRVGEALQREMQVERSNMAQWADRVVELQNLVTLLQERMDGDTFAEAVFAEQIQKLQEALETNGHHTENRLQRMEKVLQGLRLQSDIEHTLQEVNLGAQ